MKNITLFLKVIFFTFYINNFYCQSNNLQSDSKHIQHSKNDNLSEDDKKLKKIIEEVNKKNNSETKSTVYGTNGSSFEESGVNFKNYNGKE